MHIDLALPREKLLMSDYLAVRDLLLGIVIGTDGVVEGLTLSLFRNLNPLVAEIASVWINRQTPGCAQRIHPPLPFVDPFIRTKRPLLHSPLVITQAHALHEFKDPRPIGFSKTENKPPRLQTDLVEVARFRQLSLDTNAQSRLLIHAIGVCAGAPYQFTDVVGFPDASERLLRRPHATEFSFPEILGLLPTLAIERRTER